CARLVRPPAQLGPKAAKRAVYGRSARAKRTWALHVAATNAARGSSGFPGNHVAAGVAQQFQALFQILRQARRSQQVVSRMVRVALLRHRLGLLPFLGSVIAPSKPEHGNQLHTLFITQLSDELGNLVTEGKPCRVEGFLGLV